MYLRQKGYSENGKIVGTVSSLFSTRWLSLFEKKHQDSTWVFASRDGGKEYPKKPDAVIIVASYKSNFLVITKEFRTIVGNFEYGFPAGLIDKDETAEAAAIREFKEETGLSLKVNSISPPNLYSSAGMTNETVQIVIGEAEGNPSSDYLEPSENIEVILADIDLVRKMTYSTEAIGAKAWPFLFFFTQIGNFDLTRNRS